MKLKGRRFEQICHALLDAFDRNSLQAMLRIEMDADLAEIATEGNLAAQIGEIVEWAERNGKVDQLVKGAFRHNSTNAELAEVATSFDRTWLSEYSDPESSPSSPLPASWRVALISLSIASLTVIVVSCACAAQIAQVVFSVPVSDLPVATHTPANLDLDALRDGFEPNNTFEDAELLELDTVIRANFIPPKGHDEADSDYFEIRVKEDVEYRCETNHPAGVIDTMITLFDSSHRQLANSDDNNHGFGSVVSYKPEHEGLLFVLVEPRYLPELQHVHRYNYQIACTSHVDFSFATLVPTPLATFVPSNAP